jgi:hypothetical protein
MKQLLALILLVALVPCCHTPMAITLHPDDETFTVGTATSAKMTTVLPHKPGNIVVKPDTSKIKIDTVRRKKD